MSGLPLSLWQKWPAANSMINYKKPRLARTPATQDTWDKGPCSPISVSKNGNPGVCSFSDGIAHKWA